MLTIPLALPTTLTVPVHSVHGGLVAIHTGGNTLDRPLEPRNRVRALIACADDMCQTLFPLALVLARRVDHQEPGLLLGLVRLQHGLPQDLRLALDIVHGWRKVGERAVVVPTTRGHLLRAALVECGQNRIETVRGDLNMKDKI